MNMCRIIKKNILPLLYAEEIISRRFIGYKQGLRLGDLWSFLKVSFARGLSPDVALFSFPRKQYVSVSFFDFLFCLVKGLTNPGSDVPLSTWSVIKGTRRVPTDGIKIGSIVRRWGIYIASPFNREYITDRVGYI